MSEDEVRVLVEILEEVLDGEDCIPMYQFAWNARGQVGPAEITTLCQAAYDDLTSRYSFKREWFQWPITDLSAGWPVDDATPLDFDLDSEQDVSIPLQVLVPSDLDDPERRVDAT